MLCPSKSKYFVVVSYVLCAYNGLLFALLCSLFSASLPQVSYSKSAMYHWKFVETVTDAGSSRILDLCSVRYEQVVLCVLTVGARVYW